MRMRRLAAALISTGLAFTAAELIYRAYLGARQQRHLERMKAGEEVTRVETRNLGDIVRLSAERDLVYELKPNLKGSYRGGRIATSAYGS